MLKFTLTITGCIASTTFRLAHRRRSGTSHPRRRHLGFLPFCGGPLLAIIRYNLQCPRSAAGRLLNDLPAHYYLSWLSGSAITEL
ncbi:hypothetical protein J6590_011565 [Homalodisca vitripennis]|nr:hypothetical protein J6590_011565 [Homalodisca vitripennis]